MTLTTKMAPNGESFTDKDVVDAIKREIKTRKALGMTTPQWIINVITNGPGALK